MQDDLISRKDALASIKNLYPDMPVVDIFNARRKWLEKYAPYFECENAVEQLPSVKPQEPKTEWIPVSERLPEKNVWVLVTVVQGSGWYVEIMRIDKYKGMFTDNIDYYDSVIAWMPLPKPYDSQERSE